MKEIGNFVEKMVQKCDYTTHPTQNPNQQIPHHPKPYPSIFLGRGHHVNNIETKILSMTGLIDKSQYDTDI